jgi:transcriptional regulator with XRE-family HTH domain
MPTTPKTPPIRFKFDHSGVQTLIRWIMDTQGLSQYEISRRAGLNPATIFQILNKVVKDTTRQPHRSTITTIAKAAGYDVLFDCARGVIILKHAPKEPRHRHDIDALLGDLRCTLFESGFREISKKERQKIVRVVEAILS